MAPPSFKPTSALTTHGGINKIDTQSDYTICMNYHMKVKYTSNTTNMYSHLFSSSSDLVVEKTSYVITIGNQPIIKTMFKAKLSFTKSITGFLCKDLCPCSVCAEICIF